MNQDIISFSCKNTRKENMVIAGLIVSGFLAGQLIVLGFRTAGAEYTVLTYVPMLVMILTLLLFGGKFGNFAEEGKAVFEKDFLFITIGRKTMKIKAAGIFSVKYEMIMGVGTGKCTGYRLKIHTRKRLYVIRTEELDARETGFDETGLYKLYERLAENRK